MKKQFFRLLPLVLCITSINPVFAEDEQQEQLAIQQPIIEMSYKEKWTKLDSLFASYVNGFPTTSNGTHKLIVAYLALMGNNSSMPDGGESIADDWLKADPDSAVGIMLKADSYNGKAFFLRGEGAADTVDDDVWPKFKALVEQEKSYLLKHKDIADKDPMWYQLMISVARNLGDRDLLTQTLDEGSKKYPTYQNIYLDAMEASLPKWGGSPEEVDKVAQLAANRTSTQSGKSYYAYIWYNALAYQPELRDLLTSHKIISWEDIRQGWKDRFKQYPSEMIANNYMSMACLAKDKAAFNEGQAWIKEISGSMPRYQWLNGVDYNQCNHFFKGQN